MTRDGEPRPVRAAGQRLDGGGAGTAVTSDGEPPNGAPLAGGTSAYLELTKPGIAFFVVVTAAAGYAMAALPGSVSSATLFHVVLGTGLSTAGALALNQYLERRPDALMLRTRQRPVPSGRIPPARARWFGWGLAIAGVGHLLFWTGWLPALVAATAALLYNGAYTPLKLRSPLATPVGAVPGALPALIGWTAHAGAVGPGGLALFAILFLWQLVHVLALGWNLREDYVRAGFQLIPPGSPRLVAGLMLGYSAALLPVSLLPAFFGMTGTPYLAAAAALGLGLAAATVAFLVQPTQRRCRRVFHASLLYHPALLASMVGGAL